MSPRVNNIIRNEPLYIILLISMKLKVTVKLLWHIGYFLVHRVIDWFIILTFCGAVYVKYVNLLYLQALTITALHSNPGWKDNSGITLYTMRRNCAAACCAFHMAPIIFINLYLLSTSRLSLGIFRKYI